MTFRVILVYAKYSFFRVPATLACIDAKTAKISKAMRQGTDSSRITEHTFLQALQAFLSPRHQEIRSIGFLQTGNLEIIGGAKPW